MISPRCTMVPSPNTHSGSDGKKLVPPPPRTCSLRVVTAFLLPSFALDGVHVACACAAGEGSVAIGCADGTLRLFDAGEGDTTWALCRVLRCAGAGIAFAMCVVPRIDDRLVLQSSIQASSHGDAAVYP